VFCAEHAPEGVSDYRHTMCCALDCNRQGLWIDPLASANFEAYCHVHRHDQMVLRSTRRRQNASSVPSSDPAVSGVASKRNASSSVLAQEMRLLWSGNGLCAAESCKDVAMRGSRAGREREREVAPRRRSSKHLKCMHPLGCELFASFGVPGDKQRFCASHKAAHHLNLRKSCLVEGCNARPMYGVDNVLTHCGAHRSVSCARLFVRVALCVWMCV
jgi:hypothetical protein